VETTATETHRRGGRGPRYAIDIEGTIHPWDEKTITVPEIRSLGGLPVDVPVLEINLHTNEERTLPEDAVVELKPGLGFSKKIEFRRG
jgi:hypothetical protein